MTKKTLATLGLCLIVSTLVSACDSILAAPTPAPTYTPYPEPTPYPTYTPYPQPTPYPTHTPLPTPKPRMPSVADLFCEYGFCIGHPPDLYLKDIYSIDEIEEWSTYRSGVVVGIQDDQMVVNWRVSAKETWDAKLKAKDVLLDEYLPGGNVLEEMIGDMLVAYVDTKHTKTTDSHPYGVSAAWFCGDRGFRLLISSKREGKAVTLLRESLQHFACAK